MSKGHLHPLTQIIRLSLKFFTDLGFEIAEGPEIETEWYNFDALNTPADHPSRDIQDTFWLKGVRKVLRTHTTPVDVRVIKENKMKPPLRLIIPGRCFRNEPTDLTHEHTFYHLDGIVIEKDINMGHLIGLLDDYVKYIFGKDVQTRVRPHLFRFVEPGLELDIKMRDGSWREMLGAGMAHPVVLKNAGIDTEKWQGIMWGLGVDRFMMQYFNVDDIRLSYSGDLRFLKQF